jgi:hypothetical protein
MSPVKVFERITAAPSQTEDERHREQNAWTLPILRVPLGCSNNPA